MVRRRKPETELARYRSRSPAVLAAPLGLGGAFVPIAGRRWREPTSLNPDSAASVARVSAAKRDVLLQGPSLSHRLGREDLEDCFSQASLEFLARACEWSELNALTPRGVLELYPRWDTWLATAAVQLLRRVRRLVHPAGRDPVGRAFRPRSYALACDPRQRSA